MITKECNECGGTGDMTVETMTMMDYEEMLRKIMLSIKIADRATKNSVSLESKITFSKLRRELESARLIVRKYYYDFEDAVNCQEDTMKQLWLNGEKVYLTGNVNEKYGIEWHEVRVQTGHEQDKLKVVTKEWLDMFWKSKEK